MEEVKKNKIKRYVLLFLSLPVNALGIVLVTIASLGTSPISSLPYVVSKLTPLSFGELTWILNILLVGIHNSSLKNDTKAKRHLPSSQRVL